MAEKKISFTPAQTTAIETHGKDLLVSAAAGSGKTATLTERIIRSLTNEDSPADISKMLVVTFTRAAASDLRQKIFKALSKALANDPQNPRLASQLVRLENAKICTIDSFYFDVLREFSSNVGLMQGFRIADTAEVDLLAKETIEKVISDFYDRDTEGFSHFAECFVGIRGMSRLAEVLLSLYSHVSAYPEGLDFLKRSAENCFAGAELDFFNTNYGRVLKNDTIERIEYYISQLDDTTSEIMLDDDLSKKYLPSFSYDLAFCKDLLTALKAEDGYEATKKHLATYSPIKLGTARPATEFSAAVKDIRTKISKAIPVLHSKSFVLSKEEISDAMRHTARITLILHELLSEFDKALFSEKLARSILGFDDIRRLVLKLFIDQSGEPTEVARLVSERYTDIYIDEYQDVDRVQDMIFASISKDHNRFMVGDIKQSIYGFRGAEPSVFASYRRSFPSHSSNAAKDSPSESIFMSENFRCDENVIKFTNHVCSYLFSLTSESIGYTKEDDLVFAKGKPCDDYESPKVELVVITPPEDEDSDYVSSADNNRTAEARYIAGEVSRLLKEGRKADSTRILPSDIAVMFRSGKMKEHLCRAFDEAGIEYCGAEESRYFENPDVLLILSLLNVIDNPHRDIHLAATLRSPFFDLTLDDLARIRAKKPSAYSLYDALVECANDGDGELSKKCREFEAELFSWRDMTLSLPVDALLKSIYASKRFLAAGLFASDNLTLLYEYARRFESGSFKGLYNFIEYINKLIADGTTIDTGDGAVSENRVSFMTIHHSKGLEYPVCFLSGTSTEFNKNEFKDSLLLDSDVGVAMKLADKTGFARLNTPLREAIASRITARGGEEEMRVLYVALTRARERLYITGSTKKSEDEVLREASIAKKYSTRYSVMNSKSYLDWILAAISDVELSNVLTLSFIEADKITTKKATDVAEAEDVTADSDEALVKSFKEAFEFEYRYKALSKLPAKFSVSRLSPDVLDENDDTVPLFDSQRKAEVPAILSGIEKNTPSAAERGTATHLFLQFCNFRRAEKYGVIEELSRLIEKGYIPESARKLVFIDELEKFFSTELYSKIKTAKRVIREQRFNILLPPSMFSKDDAFIASLGDELLAVQGVIDLVIIDEQDKLCLYDYKTDRLTKAELENDTLLSRVMRDRHSEQLSYYKLAISRLFERECDVAEVYSTHAAKTVKV